jgi:hypothetical protein
MIVHVEMVDGETSRDVLEEAANQAGFTIAPMQVKTVGYSVSVMLDAIDLIMIAQGFRLTAAQMCNAALDTVRKRFTEEEAAEGMISIYAFRELAENNLSATMMLVFVYATDLRSLS